MHARTSRRIGALAGGLALALGAALVAAPAAQAVGANIHIAGTGGQGVNLRSAPNSSGSVVGWVPEGASPDFNCFAMGQSVGGVSVWFNVNYNGRTGYYASFYDDSHYSSGADLTARYGIPACGSGSPGAPSTSAAETAIAWMNARMGSTSYDGWCLLAVYRAYLAAGRDITAGLPYGPAHDTAYSYWTVARNRHPGDFNAPRSALVWFRSYAGAPGHVALSLGGGTMVSTWDGRTRGIHTMAIRSYDTRLYLGWTMP